jgi:pimeloyl-ACP methyl ester carboxylesterase
MRLAFGPATDASGKTSPHPYVTLAALDEVRANQSLPGTDYAALATVRGMTYADVEPKYAQLAMPVSVVWGEQDRVLPIRDAHALLSLLPEHATVVRVPDVGHMPLAESPAVVVSVIENALRAPPSSPPLPEKAEP